MKTTENTILITGGSAGIGFEIAKLFSEAGNKVIITGRNEERLNAAVAKLSNTVGIVSDVSQEGDVNALVTRITKDFPALNIVINNAGAARAYQLEEGGVYESAQDEIITNYLSVINLSEKLLPILKEQPQSAIVNVTSIVVFAPGRTVPTYSASKAALHSYTQSLRLSLADSTVKVFELMPPLVNTDFSQAIGGASGIHPNLVATALETGLENDIYEIHVEGTATFYELFKSSPEKAFEVMNSVAH